MKHFICLCAVLLFALGNVYAQKEVPNTTIKSISGESVNMDDITKTDGVKILSFWATWCVPCINELDAISEVYDDWKDETNVELIAISTDDSRTKRRIKPLVNGKDWEYQILVDENQELKRALNISVIPHVVVVKDGEIVYRHTGYSPGAEDELYDVVKKHSK